MFKRMIAFFMLVMLPFAQAQGLELDVEAKAQMLNLAIDQIDSNSKGLVLADKELKKIQRRSRKIKRIARRIRRHKKRYLRRIGKLYHKMSKQEAAKQIEEVMAGLGSSANKKSLDLLDRLELSQDIDEKIDLIVRFQVNEAMSNAEKLAADIVDAGGHIAYVKKMKRKLKLSFNGLANHKKNRTSRSIASLDHGICSAGIFYGGFGLMIALLSTGNPILGGIGLFGFMAYSVVVFLIAPLTGICR